LPTCKLFNKSAFCVPGIDGGAGVVGFAESVTLSIILQVQLPSFLLHSKYILLPKPPLYIFLVFLTRFFCFFVL
jgi:hypothetical protein